MVQHCRESPLAASGSSKCFRPIAWPLDASASDEHQHRNPSICLLEHQLSASPIMYDDSVLRPSFLARARNRELLRTTQASNNDALRKRASTAPGTRRLTTSN